MTKGMAVDRVVPVIAWCMSRTSPAAEHTQDPPLPLVLVPPYPPPTSLFKMIPKIYALRLPPMAKLPSWKLPLEEKIQDRLGCIHNWGDSPCWGNFHTIFHQDHHPPLEWLLYVVVFGEEEHFYSTLYSNVMPRKQDYRWRQGDFKKSIAFCRDSPAQYRYLLA